MKKTLLSIVALFFVSITTFGQASPLDPTAETPRVRVADSDYTANFTSGTLKAAGSGANVAISNESLVNGTISFDVVSSSTDFVASIKFQVRKLYGNSGSIDFTMDGTTDSFDLPKDAAAENLDAFEVINLTFSKDVTISSTPITITLDVKNIIKDAASSVTFRYYNVTFTNLTLSTDDFDAKTAAITAYPNPVTNSFQINSSENVEDVKLYNISGRLVKTFKASANYDVSDLATGVYMTTIKTQLGSKTLRLVKQ
ncbi:T9SS type A sorting domain-containing protein [uncultured Polaribacter sp.]|uniref:T9SS type A sorting domain-containing protein n=1 Tax=uncultured Polaribacter sp. TaxID=174711 RepID=UPI002614C056|nr:T9SS type A sorting domain-containing protein [uncultured Polaribacter sp.]